ncbi:peptidoglycan-associated lipoprotein Pal [candidate division KSB1 bacterium]|nr:peptidoglycan-associated lipoprotein Pal [candidate division KSB1 bacterium]NIR72658.1 peptidoglycan-associated lipoprotein Pal [candidate division KSB1 bacterium]NIS23688.1 peptidoglycan-associated lipoprotein Pal [candidate division KSB1 bacterium]NIT70608.1 peptidoglycan-associated lipoprotein Pal [candidate division KSB1 bacterium]NIU24336.1 peptidoglycan-associated lipoprotein Pal [candidate division KSB1 bacterium]
MNMNKTSLLAVLVLGSLALLLLACGGQKETVEYTPDPFPEPDSIREEPAEREPVQPEPVRRDEPEPRKEPLRLETVHFEFDKSDLTREARAILAENARKLEENPTVDIRIEGHCDERGTVEYNLALGERRALSARNYLINYGINPGRITIISYGKERPLDTRHTPEAWAQNRRAEFIILNQ